MIPNANAEDISTPSYTGRGYNPSVTYNNTLDTNLLTKGDIKNITNPPKYEELKKLPSVNINAAIMLINSGDIASVFIDTKTLAIVLNTKSGGRVYISSLGAMEFLNQPLFNNKVDVKYLEFSRKKIAGNTVNTGDSLKGIRTLFFLLLFIGAVLTFNRDKIKFRRKKVVVKDGVKQTVYQTRSGEEGSIPEVTFKDVAGCEEAVEDLRELAEFLKNPDKFNKLGAKVPRGAILQGPPGTGKTLLARAVAGEAQVPFFSCAGSDFVEMYVGVGAARVRELFSKARNAGRAIIFIDEIDAVAKSRSYNGHNGNDEREGTLNALLHELDGFNRSNIILLAATNRIELLDPAILRPGRLDRKITVPNPDRKGRLAILKIHATGKPLDSDVDLELIAKRTPGMSGAELSSVINEAAIEAGRRDLDKINASCLSDAVALVAMGRARKSAVVTEKDKLITAWHEAGHTICALQHPDAQDPVSVSITPRGHAGGITWMSGSDDLYLQRKQAAAQLIVAMGGRAAEEILLDGEFTQGPMSDLMRATELATTMVNNYGMTRRGLSVRESDANTHEVVEELLSRALEDAKDILNSNQELMSLLIERLLEVETLEYQEILDIRDSIKVKNKRGNLSKTMNYLKNSKDELTEILIHEKEEIIKKYSPKVRESKKLRKFESVKKIENDSIRGLLKKIIRINKRKIKDS